MSIKRPSSFFKYAYNNWLSQESDSSRTYLYSCRGLINCICNFMGKINPWSRRYPGPPPELVYIPVLCRLFKWISRDCYTVAHSFAKLGFNHYNVSGPVLPRAFPKEAQITLLRGISGLSLFVIFLFCFFWRIFSWANTHKLTALARHLAYLNSNMIVNGVWAQRHLQPLWHLQTQYEGHGWGQNANRIVHELIQRIKIW